MKKKIVRRCLVCHKEILSSKRQYKFICQSCTLSGKISNHPNILKGK